MYDFQAQRFFSIKSKKKFCALRVPKVRMPSNELLSKSSFISDSIHAIPSIKWQNAFDTNNIPITAKYYREIVDIFHEKWLYSLHRYASFWSIISNKQKLWDEQKQNCTFWFIENIFCTLKMKMTISWKPYWFFQSFRLILNWFFLCVCTHQ